LVAELKAATIGQLDELLRRMFDSADDTLFEMGEKSPNDAERRRYFDTMRVLRLDRSKVASGFAEDLDRGFTPSRVGGDAGAQFDLDSLSIQPTEELEERIAITNMAAKAEGLYKSQIWELERRLETASRDFGAVVSPIALSPGRICEAFSKGTASLDTDFQIKLVIFKLFDRVVIRDLGRVYSDALELLDRVGVTSSRKPRPQAPQPPPPAPMPLLPMPTFSPAPQPPQPPAYEPPAGYNPGNLQQPPFAPPGYTPPAYQPPGYGATPPYGQPQAPSFGQPQAPAYGPQPPPAHPAQGPGVHGGTAGYQMLPGFDQPFHQQHPPQQSPMNAQAQVQELLRQYGLDPASQQKVGAPLMSELAGLLQTLVSSPAATALQASTQRLSLAGKMFDEILSEPLLPEPLRPAIERLRYPVYRTALTDPSFFVNQSHPVRKLLTDLVELSVAAQTSESAQMQLREAMRSAAALNSGGPALAPDALKSSQPVPDSDVDSFLQQLRQQTRARREVLLTRVRRQIAQELEVHTIGREVPGEVMQLLRGGVGPLMAVRLLKNGRGSPPYKEAQGMMEQVLSSLEFVPPASPEEIRGREQLMSNIVSAFASIGMGEDKIEALLNGLQEVYSRLDRAEPKQQPQRFEEKRGRIDRRRPGQEDRHGAEQRRGPRRASDVEAGGQPAGPDGRNRTRIMELLGRVLVAESWFRVYHAEQNQTRWLKLNSFYPEQDAVTFTGFDESQKLNLRALRFAEDLARGQSEPINPDEPARDALDQLRSARSKGLF
jgi:hypothetical protein